MNKYFEYPGGSVNFVLTDEGLVIDVFDKNGEPIATEGKTAVEWAEVVLNIERLRTRLREHDAVFGHGD